MTPVDKQSYKKKFLLRKIEERESGITIKENYTEAEGEQSVQVSDVWGLDKTEGYKQ
jgi:hypothetical protein